MKEARRRKYVFLMHFSFLFWSQRLVSERMATTQRSRWGHGDPGGRCDLRSPTCSMESLARGTVSSDMGSIALTYSFTACMGD